MTRQNAEIQFSRNISKIHAKSFKRKMLTPPDIVSIIWNINRNRVMIYDFGPCTALKVVSPRRRIVTVEFFFFLQRQSKNIVSDYLKT